MVNHNAFAKGKRAKEFTPVIAVAEVPEEVPTKVTIGTTAVMLVRRGEVVHALRETCSHAGGPLSKGELKGDTSPARGTVDFAYRWLGRHGHGARQAWSAPLTRARGSSRGRSLTVLSTERARRIG